MPMDLTGDRTSQYKLEDHAVPDRILIILQLTVLATIGRTMYT